MSDTTAALKEKESDLVNFASTNRGPKIKLKLRDPAIGQSAPKPKLKLRDPAIGQPAPKPKLKLRDPAIGQSAPKPKSKEVNLRPIWPPFHINPSDMLIPTMDNKKHIAGFLDGDGCISMDERDKLIEVSFKQSGSDDGPPEILRYVQRFYGGTITDNGKESKDKRRAYKLRLTGSICLHILLDLLPFLALKSPQAKIAIDYLQYRAGNSYLPFTDPLRVWTFTQLKALKEVSEYKKVIIDPSRLTLPYLAGLFDAEGCAQAGRRRKQRVVTTSITQKNSPNLLDAIKLVRGQNGSISGGQIRFSSRIGLQFLTAILPYSVYKRPQIELAIELIGLLNIHWLRRTKAQEVRIDYCIDEISRLKHV